MAQVHRQPVAMFRHIQMIWRSDPNVETPTKLRFPDLALENTLGVNCWENQRKTPRLVLSVATEDRLNARNKPCGRIYKMILLSRSLNNS